MQMLFRELLLIDSTPITWIEGRDKKCAQGVHNDSALDSGQFVTYYHNFTFSTHPLKRS